MASIFDIVREVPGSLADVTEFTRPGGLAQLVLQDEARRRNPMLQTLGGQFGQGAQLATGGALGTALLAGGGLAALPALGASGTAGLAGLGSAAAPAAGRAAPAGGRLINTLRQVPAQVGAVGRQAGRDIFGRNTLPRLRAARSGVLPGQLGQAGRMQSLTGIQRAGQFTRALGRAGAGSAGALAGFGTLGAGVIPGVVDRIRGEDDIPLEGRSTRLGRQSQAPQVGQQPEGGAGQPQLVPESQRVGGAAPLPAIDPIEPVPTPEGAFARIESGFEKAIQDLQRREELGDELLGQLPGRVEGEFGRAQEAVGDIQGDVLGQFDEAAVSPEAFLAEGGFSPIREALEASQAARLADVPLLEAGFQQLLGGARTGLEQARAEALAQEQQRLGEFEFQSQLQAQELNQRSQEARAGLEFKRDQAQRERDLKRELATIEDDNAREEAQRQAEQLFPEGMITPERVPFMQQSTVERVWQDAPQDIKEKAVTEMEQQIAAALEADEDPFLAAYQHFFQNMSNRPLLASIILAQRFGPVSVGFGGG